MKRAEKPDPLLFKLPTDQVTKVLHESMCDIDATFLGFTDTYAKLSKIIPKHFTIIDLGCAYNPQCFYFTKHKKYVAVDESDCAKFQAPNCVIYQKKIESFIAENLHEYNLEETFAICNYVPLREETHELVRRSFKNLYMYYPHNDEEQGIIAQVMKRYFEKNKKQ